MSSRMQAVLPALGGGLAVAVIFVAVLSLPLSAAEPLGLSGPETASWIAGLYGIPAVVGIILSVRYRQPLVVTGNIFIIIFVVRLGGDVPWAELVGASMLAGALVLVLGPLGLTDRLARWLPAPVVFGLLAGAVLPFFKDLFVVLGRDATLNGVDVAPNERLMAAATLAAYLAGRRWAEPRVPAIVPALVVGTLVAALTGGFGAASGGGEMFMAPVLTTPSFSLSAILTATPVMIVFIALQANAPSVVFLRSQGFDPPERTVSAVSGVGTVAGSLLGPIGVSLSLPSTALTATPDAGRHHLRYWGAVVSLGIALVVALFSGIAADLATVVARPLLVALVGVAVVDVLARALREVTQGPLVLGPLFAFAIALTDIELLRLGSFFWALAGGLLISLFLERDGWRRLQEDAPKEAEKAPAEA
ncbi:MAG: benzoate/H(+) symporter BenE family transporter [Nitriliruptorales bacterium]|nr:benzoate/H(+) symporter BenE family transporter [Nitriliruptorales bacterium]